MIGVLVAAGIAVLVAMAATPMLIEYFRARGVGQIVSQDVPTTHFSKSGTPTMGGLVILGAATIGYLLAHVRLIEGGLEIRLMSAPAILVLAGAWALGAVGFFDDLSKVRGNGGLRKGPKMAGTVVVGALIAWGAVAWAGLPTAISWAGSFAADPLPVALFAGWVVLFVAGTSHAVNLTDGTDGMAAGASTMVLFVFAIIAFWQFRNPEIYTELAATSDGLLDVAIVAAAIAGATAGFLWWNAAPAPVIMGDTGALALGGAMAVLALFTGTQLLLPVLGGLFVIETLSVMMQVTAFRRFGRRIFLRAPLHHHFEERGWEEITVTIRFWLIAALCAGLGLSLFYMHFLNAGGGG